jgi:endonuclease YncB( thermonuclease family)
VTRRPRTLKLATIIAALMITTASAEPLSITGPARVVDGDTLVVGTTRVRLKGVDAAERGTDLGEAARIVMETIVGGGPLTCRLTGEKTWRREVGFCFTSDGTDINREIIEQGAALACPRYDTRYVKFEQADAVAAQARASYCVRR